MTDEYIYIYGVGSRKYKISEELNAALLRAKAWYRLDRVNMVIHIASRNLEAPLTDIEKERLEFRLGLEGCPYEIIFDN